MPRKQLSAYCLIYNIRQDYSYYSNYLISAVKNGSKIYINYKKKESI
jgi:hypothetical protein